MTAARRSGGKPFFLVMRTRSVSTAGMHNTTKSGPNGGRPAKFGEPSRHVTLTLPARVLDRLANIDADRAKAIVKAVEFVLSGERNGFGTVGELRVGTGEKLLVVPENRLLRSIPWLTLIEIAPGRSLISLKKGSSVEKLEVTLGDILDSHPDATPAERETIHRLLACLRTPRRNRAIWTEEILVIGSNP